MLEVKFEANINVENLWKRRESWWWGCWHRHPWETRDARSDELNGGELITTREESDCDESLKRPRRKSCLQNLHVKGNLRAISWNWMCEGSHLEADPNLERSIIIHQDTGKTVCAQNNLYSEEDYPLYLTLNIYEQSSSSGPSWGKTGRLERSASQTEGCQRAIDKKGFRSERTERRKFQKI